MGDDEDQPECKRLTLKRIDWRGAINLKCGVNGATGKGKRESSHNQERKAVKRFWARA